MNTRATTENPYASPAAIELSAESPITSFKRQNKIVLIVSSFFSLWCIPCGVAIAAMMWGILPGRRSLLLVPFIVGGSAAFLFALRYWSNRRYRALGRRIAKRLNDDNVDVARWGGQFVQFAPAGDVRLYDLHTEWDVGYLFLLGDRLTYLGEQTRFSIPRADIQRITIGYGAVELPLSYQTRVHWFDRARNEVDTFSVWPGTSEITLRSSRLAMLFADQIQQWQLTGKAIHELPMWSELSTPNFELVESKSVDEAVPLYSQILGGFFNALAAAFITFLVGDAMQVSPGWWPATIALSLAMLTLLVVCIQILIQRYVLELPPPKDLPPASE